MLFALGTSFILLVCVAYIFFAKQNSIDLRHSFTVWLLFGILLSLVPIVFNLILVYLKGEPIKLDSVIGRGELFLVAVCLGANSLGKLIGSGTSQRTFKIIVGGGNILILIIASLMFASVSAQDSELDAIRVSESSLYTYYSMLLVSGFCEILSGFD